MIKFPNFLLIAILLTTSTVSAQAITEAEFLEINKQYTQAYFNYLQFKKETPLRAELLKKAIESGLISYKEAQVMFLKEQRVLSTLENELAGIINETLETSDNVTEANQIIANLKDDAVMTGLFSENDRIETDSILAKVKEREINVEGLSQIINELELKITTIKETTEWIELVTTYNTINSALDSAYSKRVFLESNINKYMTLITETNSEISVLQENITDLETEEEHLDNAFPGARRRVEDARHELSDVTIRLGAAESQYNSVSRERSSLNLEQSKVERSVQGLRLSLDRKVIRLDELERNIAKLPTLRSRLRDLNNNKIPQVNNEFQRAQGQVDQVRNSLQLSQRELTESNKALERAKAQKREASTQMATIDRQINVIKRKVQELKKEEANIGQYEQRLQNLRDQKNELERKLQRSNRDLQNARSAASDAKQKHQAITAQVREANTKLSRIDGQRKQMKRNISGFNEKIKNLQQEIRVLERAGNATGQLEQSLRDSLKRKANLEKRLQNNNNKAQNLKRKRREFRNKIQELREKVTNGNPSREEKRELLKEIKRVTAELKKNNEDLSKTEANITRLTGEVTREDRKIANIRRQINSGGDAARRIQQLRQNIQDEEVKKTREERQLAIKNREYNEESSRLTSLAQRQQRLKTELTRAQAALGRSESIVTSVKSEITTNGNQISRVRRRLDNATAARSEIIRLRSEIQKLGETRSEFEKRLNRAERRLVELRSEVSRTQETIRRIGQDLESLRGRLNDIRRRLTRLTEEASSLKSEIDRLSLYRNEADALRNNGIPNSRSELQRAVRELESINLRLQSVNQDYRRLALRVEDLIKEKLEDESLFETVSLEFSRIEERMDWVKLSLKTSRAKVTEGFRLLPEYRKSMVQTESELKILGPELSNLETQIIVAKDGKDKFYAQNLEPLVTENLVQIETRDKVVSKIDQYTGLALELQRHLTNIEQFNSRLSSLAISKVVIEEKVFSQRPTMEASENEYRNKEADYRASVNGLEALRNDIVLKRQEVKDLKEENDRALSEVR